jgi:hypothetical protein
LPSLPLSQDAGASKRERVRERDFIDDQEVTDMKVGKHNALSGNTASERDREREREERERERESSFIDNQEVTEGR